MGALPVYSKKKFGIGIELGIGIQAQPHADMASMVSNTRNMATLSPFLNFEDSPVNLYNMAQNQGFCQALTGIL